MLVVQIIPPEPVKSISDTVDEDLEIFSEYFCKQLGNSALVLPEIAILRTYLLYKLAVQKPEP